MSSFRRYLITKTVSYIQPGRIHRFSILSYLWVQTNLPKSTRRKESDKIYEREVAAARIRRTPSRIRRYARRENMAASLKNTSNASTNGFSLRISGTYSVSGNAQNAVANSSCSIRTPPLSFSLCKVLCRATNEAGEIGGSREWIYGELSLPGSAGDLRTATSRNWARGRRLQAPSFSTFVSDTSPVGPRQAPTTGG